ncbi:MAG: hypothetical protein DRN29_11105 [Thermoplasmata archaeon]|nr:MAG: hypothetical protein DRN29_11105 [Thermoplasmata archaeon]
MRWMSILAACLLMAVVFYPLVTEGKEKRDVVFSILTPNCMKERKCVMTEKEIHLLLNNLEKLRDAIERDDRKMIEKLVKEIEDQGLKEISAVTKLLNRCDFVWNLSNLFCLTFGFGCGMIYFRLDSLLLALSYIPLFDPIMSARFILLSMITYLINHVYPVRFILSLTFFEIFEGSLNTYGLKGVKKITESWGVILGFVGIIINLYIVAPRGPLGWHVIPFFFCLGYSLLALEEEWHHKTSCMAC